MAVSSRSHARTLFITAAVLAVGACSSDSTNASSHSIIGHVTIDAGDARIPAENLVSARTRAPLAPMASHRAREAQRINVVFRREALGLDRLGAMSVRTVERARQVGLTIRTRLAAHPAAALFSVTDVSPVIGAARIRVRDRSQLGAVIAALRADPAVASVDVDRLLSRGPESRVKLSAALKQQILASRDARGSSTPGAEGLRFAGASASRIQFWHYNLIDAPRAWALPDTGDKSVYIAVIDDGYNEHPDVDAELRARRGELRLRER